MKKRGLDRLLIALGLALCITGIFIALSGENPLNAYYQLIKGALWGRSNLITTLRWSVPYLIASIAAAVSFKAGVFNLGIEGCVYLGGLTAALIGAYFQGLPPLIHISLAIFGAMVVSALWLSIPAYLKAYHNVNEVITTWMFTYIAILLCQYLVRNIFFDPTDIGSAAQQVRTPYIMEAAKLKQLFPPYQLNFSIFIGITLMIIFYIFIKKTRSGYDLSMLGTCPNFAKYGGINIEKTQFYAILVSGSIGGILGACEVLGVHHRYIHGFSNDLATLGIMVALMGRLNPVSMAIAALFMGIMQNGARAMSRVTNVSLDTVLIMIALVVILISAEEFFEIFKIRQRVKQSKKGES